MAVKPKTVAELQAERIAEMNHFLEANSRRSAQQAEREGQHHAFLQRVEAAREARAKALERGEELPATPPVKRLAEIYGEQRQREILEAERLEQERRNAIPQRDNIIAALPFAVRERISTYEKIRGTPFPLEALSLQH